MFLYTIYKSGKGGGFFFFFFNNKSTPISCVRKKFRFDIDEFPDVRMCINI